MARLWVQLLPRISHLTFAGAKHLREAESQSDVPTKMQTINPIRRPNQLTLFWSHVAKPIGVGCWLWTGNKTTQGYWRHGKQFAHRLAWALEKGSIPDGLRVLHRCDNPSCCNPDHLFLGTQKENIADCIAKGRRAIVTKAMTAANLAKGRVLRKVTPEMIAIIKSERSQIVPTPCAVLAARFGISACRVSHLSNHYQSNCAARWRTPAVARTISPRLLRAELKR